MVMLSLSSIIIGINDKDILGDLSIGVSGTSALPPRFESVDLIIKAGVPRSLFLVEEYRSG